MLAMRALPPTLSPTVAPSMELVRHAAAELAEEAHTPADLPRFYNPAHLRRWIGVWSHSCALDASRCWDAAFADLEPVGRPRLEPLATPHGGQR